jgi:class 3 adenylate cyclase/tetratricopeptide (TPR) repeat protein
MECPKCQTENPDKRKFCRECGTKLFPVCLRCGYENLPGDKFCGECGERLEEALEIKREVPDYEGERRQVTSLFSDLSGYTALGEKIDPEEVRDITSQIFNEISKIVNNYDGFIEKFAGDAVMALFGATTAHEDDPIRAIRAAMNIHRYVESISPKYEKEIGQPLSMHSGINTGLVVTGEVNLEKGTHGVIGEPINLASRLSTLAKPGEILTGTNTFRRAEGHFSFEELDPVKLKGKAESIQIYKVLSAKEKPVKIHRLSGLRADLIGRKVEIAELSGAVENLLNRKGKIFSISGDAGTGKSRLVEEFKATLDLEEIQWIEGHAYAYSQNIPYFPLSDLLNRVFQIEETDPPEKVRDKVEYGITDLVGREKDVIPYIGSLYALNYPEIEGISPEFWKSRLQNAMTLILSALANKAPTVFCLEDLHWADSSFIELLRHTILEIRQPAMVLCIYRPIFTLFSSHQLQSVVKFYQEIKLQDLPPSEAQNMLESLLKTETIPSDLKRFVQDKAGGNPFYLEELVNSLIESETLIQDNGSWRVTRHLSASNISSTINGVITGRLDRLERKTKRILQEASVIGRTFLFEILKRITELKEDIDLCLRGLEQLDLIRARARQPDLEYVFKHALTQEVVYNGLLNKERQAIHEKIAIVIEQLFHDRLAEFYETLAFHFARGQSIIKAVDYLMKSGEKSAKRYALEEAHQYYKNAFDILSEKTKKSKEEKKLLIELLIEWAYVYNFRGDNKGMNNLLQAHKNIAESLEDKGKIGMYYGWFGFGLYLRGRAKDSYHYLCRALELGQEIKNKQLIGYAYAWLTWTCTDLGLLDEAIIYGERAQKISILFADDAYLHYNSKAATGYAYWRSGDGRKAIEIGKDMLDYGQSHSTIRDIVWGHVNIGLGYFAAGDLLSAIDSFLRAIQISTDPFYTEIARIFLSACYIIQGRLQEAEVALRKVLSFSQDFGAESMGTPAYAWLGVVEIVKGRMRKGLTMLETGMSECRDNGRKSLLAHLEYTMGKVYMQLIERSAPISLSIVVKNIGFLLKNLPIASRKAGDHFYKAIQIAKEIGAKHILGQAYLDFGLLNKAKGKKDKAREYISKSIQVFEQCGADVYLKQAKEEMESLY